MLNIVEENNGQPSSSVLVGFCKMKKKLFSFVLLAESHKLLVPRIHNNRNRIHLFITPNA